MGKVKAKEQKTNKGCTRLKTRGSAKVRRECKNNNSSTLRSLYGMSERSVKSRSIERPFRAQEADFIGLVESKVRSGKAARITRCLRKDCSKAITVENEAGNGRIWLIWNITMTLTRYIDLIRLDLVAAGGRKESRVSFQDRRR